MLLRHLFIDIKTCVCDREREREQWTVDSGQWTVDNGQWTVDSGRQTVDNGGTLNTDTGNDMDTVLSMNKYNSKASTT